MNSPDPKPPLTVVHSERQDALSNADVLVESIPTPTLNPGDALRNMSLEHSLRSMLIAKFEPLGIKLQDASVKDRYSGIERRYTLAQGAGLELALLQIPRWIIANNNNIGPLVALGSAFGGIEVRIISQKQEVGAFGLQRVFDDWGNHYGVRARFVPWNYIKELHEGRFGPEEILALELKGRSAPAPADAVPATQADAGPRSVRIFLASSEELRTDRDAFELYFRQLNDRLRKRGVYLEVIRWENFLDAMSGTRLQDEYNQSIRTSDIFVSLFMTKTGTFTEEEFDVAHQTFQASGKPLIYTFFKNVEISIADVRREDIESLLNFKDKLSALKHFYTQYDNIEHLKRQFSDQLEKLLDQGKI
jgi:hypothetical protein